MNGTWLLIGVTVALIVVGIVAGLAWLIRLVAN